MRLTQNIKDTIINKVLKKKFDTRTEEVATLKTKLAHDVYNNIKDISKINILPEKWFARCNSFAVYFNGRYCSLELTEIVNLPYFVKNSKMYFGEDDLFTKQFNEYCEIDRKLTSDKNELERELKHVLNSVTTDKRLFEIWPESKEYFPENAMMLPALVNVDKLKSLLQ